jgi:DNA-binding Lrp family transcriptional regulator
MATNEPSEQLIYSYRLNMEHRGDIIHYLGYHPIPESERPTREKHRLGLDDLDRRILNIMQEDARLSFRTVARRLRVSDATIRDRVTRLQENDIIKAFTVLVDPQKAGMEVTCLIQLEVRPEQVPSTVASLSSVDEVKLVMETGERQNVVVLAMFPDRAALNQFLDKAIRGQPGVQLSNVTITLNLRKFDWLIHM